MSERQIQKELINYLKSMGAGGLFTQHVNNTPRGPRHGAFLRDMGVVKGFPDLIHFYNGEAYIHELKAKKGRLSPEQKDVHERLRVAGFVVIVSYGFDEAVKHLAEKGLTRG